MLYGELADGSHYSRLTNVSANSFISSLSHSTVVRSQRFSVESFPGGLNGTTLNRTTRSLATYSQLATATSDTCEEYKGNGACDEFNNKEDCSYDDGDCCECKYQNLPRIPYFGQVFCANRLHHIYSITFRER